MKEFLPVLSEADYAVFVRNFNFLGNNNSTVKISSMLIPVVAITLMMKSKILPKSSHSRKIIYP
jgi:undecaprenyl pyrophosphate phosphatase UppP